MKSTPSPDAPGRPTSAADPDWDEACIASAANDAAERRWRSRLDGVDAIVWEADPETFAFSYVSARAEAILGYPVAQWLADPNFWVSILHPDDRDEALRYCMERTAAGEDHAFEYRVIAADGRVVRLRDLVRVIEPSDGERRRLVGVMIDLTDRDAAAAALWSSEERSRVIFAQVHVGMVRVSLENRWLDANAAFLELVGYSWDELRGLPPSTITHADDQAEDRVLAMKLMRGEIDSVVREKRYLRKDGSFVWASVNAAAIRDATGAIESIVGICRDITQERAARQAIEDEGRLRATLSRFGRTLTEQLDLDVVAQAVTDEATRLIGADVGAFFYTVPDESAESGTVTRYALAGIPREAFAGIPLPAATHFFGPNMQAGPSIRSDDVLADPRYGRSGPFHGLPSGHTPVRSFLALPIVSRSGAAIGGLAFGHSRPGVFTERDEHILGGIAGWASVAVDNATLYRAAQRELAERQRAEAALRESEARYRVLFAASPLPMWVFERDTLRFVAVNEAAVRHYGYSREEFLAMTAHQIRPPEDISDFDAARDSMPTSGSASGRFRHRKKDGSVIEVEIAHEVLELDGRAARLVVVNDVTERKLLEAQLRQAQKMEAVGRLAGGIAHDFNNLLTVILSHASLASQDAAVGTELAEDLTEISAAGKRAAELTRQLLTFARRHVSEPRVLDVNQVASGVDRMLRRLIGEDVALETHLGADLWSVRADPGQLEQVLVNLAVNARDAMPHGGALTIATQNVQVGPGHAPRHPQLSSGDYVLLSVSDTGHGIAAADLPYVFEPFFTTKAAGVGTGLGLATCYGIVHQHGGQIAVSSPAEGGATFDVYLPRVAGIPESGIALASRPTARGSETILVVEDDPSVRAIAVRALGRHGYTTLAASDGQEGLEVAAAYAGPIDLLLTDVIMPQISGRELAVQLAERRPGLRVLYTSGYTQNVIAQHGVLDPGLHFLAKPYIPGTLLEKVREVLDTTV